MDYCGRDGAKPTTISQQTRRQLQSTTNQDRDAKNLEPVVLHELKYNDCQTSRWATDLQRSPCNPADDKPTDDSYVTLLAMLPGSQTPPSQRVSRREIRTLIEDAIEQLPPDYARVVRGCDLEGRETTEMAEEMGRSSGAIYMLRARAHDWLAEILGESTQFFGKSA